MVISGQGGHSFYEIFDVLSNVVVTLNSLAITNGSDAGMFNYGTLTLNLCTLSGNGGTDGGAVRNDGTMTLNQCVLSGNYANSLGGGICNFNGTMTLNQCVLSQNTGRTGGGILNDDGTMTLNECTLSGNTTWQTG